MEEGAVSDRKSKRVEAHSQHHVIRRIITIALTAALKESGHCLPAEDHAATQGRNVIIKNNKQTADLFYTVILVANVRNNLKTTSP